MIQIDQNTIRDNGKQIGRIEGDNVHLTRPITSADKTKIKRARPRAPLKFLIISKSETLKPWESPPPEAHLSAPALQGIIQASPVTVIQPSHPGEVDFQEPAEYEPSLVTPDDLPYHLQQPAMGDKTPAFIEWFRAHRTPEQFQARYGRRIIPASQADCDTAERRLRARLKHEKPDLEA